jgi:hypothetical protein
VDGSAVNEVMAEARAVTGLHDFGDDAFRQPLAVLLDAMTGEADLTEEALSGQRAEIVGQLCLRLRTEDFLTRFPDIVDQPVVAPVVIVGPQRSGTSKLFRLIAADPQWNRLLTWQAMNLVPLGPGKPDGDDPRVALAERRVEELRWLQPAHTVDAHAPEMEAFLLAANFLTNSPTRLVPTHQRYTETADFAPSYRYLRRQLQFLQWQTDSPAGRRWILKSPTHLPSLEALVAEFPDATLVMTHRHPRTNVASMLKLVELAQQHYARTVDRDRIRECWLHILRLNIARFLAFRRDHGDGRMVDIAYRQVDEDAVAAVRVIYERSDAPFTHETLTAISSWEQDNPQHQQGSFDYNLADFGLDDNDINILFAEYIDRFSTLI